VWTGGSVNAPLPSVAPLRPKGSSGEGAAVAFEPPVSRPPAELPAPAPSVVALAPAPASPANLDADGPGFALKAAMFAFGALSGVVVLFLVLWLTGLSERVLR
jgi:hypothetical protein